MTVQELIVALQRIEDKSLKVYFSSTVDMKHGDREPIDGVNKKSNQVIIY